MNTGLICECGHLCTKHVPLSAGKRGGCLDTKCPCFRFEAPPANTMRIVVAVRRMQHAALMEGSDAN